MQSELVPMPLSQFLLNKYKEKFVILQAIGII